MHFYLSKRYVPKNCVYGFFTNFSSRKLFKKLYFKYRWAFLTWKSKIWRDWSLPHFEIRRDGSPPKFWKIFRKFGEIRAFHSERLKYPVFITTAFWNLSLSLAKILLQLLRSTYCMARYCFFDASKKTHNVLVSSTVYITSDHIILSSVQKKFLNLFFIIIIHLQGHSNG